MFSWVTNLSTAPIDAEAMWAVISSSRPNQMGERWAALVSAMVCPATGEFAFEFDSRLGRLGHSFIDQISQRGASADDYQAGYGNCARGSSRRT